MSNSERRWKRTHDETGTARWKAGYREDAGVSTQEPADGRSALAPAAVSGGPVPV